MSGDTLIDQRGLVGRDHLGGDQMLLGLARKVGYVILRKNHGHPEFSTVEGVDGKGD